MKRLLIVAILSFIVLQACKKDESDPNPNPGPQESVLDYFPLTIGNYWIYKISSCDSTWTVCDSVRMDSNYVSKDTLINGLKYYKISGRNFLSQDPLFIRDSLDYLVDMHGQILFSNKDFTDTLYEKYIIGNDSDTLFHWYSMMDKDPFVVQVPAGEFTCLDNKTSFFRKKDNFEVEFNTHYALSKNVGPVYDNAMFGSNTSGYKRELVRYHIQDE